MAYKTKDLMKQALKVIKEKKLFFIDDVVTLLPCTKPTFYAHFPVDSTELTEIKEALEENRVAIKTAMRSKWFNSNNPTLQIALMKMICTDEERKKISNNYIEGNVELTTNAQIFKIGDQVIKFS
tara:strand:+ start:2005 stop:2379 length:375 start_codon:yes stop_codon:yes gene_type:complete